MLQVLASLTTLIAAASLVNLANTTMTTVMPLRMLEDGASDIRIALFGAAFFLGFAIGCFTQPSIIQRIGYIRAFAAAAGACTVLAVAMDLTDSVTLWIVLRGVMGLCLAAIFAAVDGWINATTPDAKRGQVFAAYGWCLGASAVVSQLLLVRFDGMTVGFIVVLAMAFNIGLVLVAMTRTTAPPARHDGETDVTDKGLVFTSVVSVAAAVYAGLVTTAILAVLPATLAQHGVDEAAIGAVIGAFFLGRLLLQIPVGIISDRMDLRLLVAIIAGLAGVTAVTGALLVASGLAHVSEDLGWSGRALFLFVMLLLGGLILPLYTLANSLAFARARGRPAVRISTSLLLANSAGAVAGPLTVAAAMTRLGDEALPVVIALASALMVACALIGRRGTALPPVTTGLSEVPTTSVISSGSMAEAKFADLPPDGEQPD